MKLSKLASKPQLIKVSIDDEETIKEYGESFDFWIHDRQDLDTFALLAMTDPSDFVKIAPMVAKMILDEDGTQVIKDGLTLPDDILMKAIQRAGESLGKPRKSTLTIQEQK